MIPIPIILPIEYGSGGVITKEWFLSLPLYLKILDICLAACLLNTLVFLIIMIINEIRLEDEVDSMIVMTISLGVTVILGVIISFIQ